MRLRNFLPIVALAPMLLLSACDGDDSPGPGTTSVPSGTASSGATAPGETPGVETPAGTPGTFNGSATPVEVAAPAGLGQATLVDVRAAAQTGFDRLVLEFNGSQIPGYSVKYAAEAIACGSGQDLTAFIGDGKAPAGLLLVTVRPAVSHDGAGQATAARALRPGLDSVIHAFRTCDFEGVVTYAVAVSDKRPFKVTTLQNPPRLVIDIAQ